MRKNSFLWSRRFTTGPSVHLSGKVLIAAALLCLGTATELDAQKRTKVTIRTERTNFKKVIREIEKQTDYDVFYNSKMLPTEDFSFQADQQDVKNVLSTLCAKYGLEYTIKNNTITLRPKQEGKSGQQKQTTARKVELKGNVTDEAGLPLPGVSVKFKGETKGVSTDTNGRFKLMVDEGSKPTLVCSMVGMKTQEVRVKTIKELDIVMQEDSHMLDEVVAIGYATQARSDLTGSISSLDTRIIESSAATSITDMIQGQIPGLSVTLGDGAPGSSAKLEIRGASTLSGNSSPLIVIDDVPMAQDYDINMLNPYDVKTLDVLKGASATAIYGSRASGGVIMITTKKGTANQKPVINYGFDYGWQQLTSDIRTLSADEYKMLLIEAARNEARAQGYEDISDYGNYQTFTTPGYFGEANTPWMQMLMQDAVTQQHRVSIQGGGKGSSYNASFSYLDEQGMIKTLYNRRYTFSAGFNTDISNKLRATVSIQGSFGRKNNNQQAMDIANEGRPDMPAYNEDGSYYHLMYQNGSSVSYTRNPIAEICGTSDIWDSNNLTLSGSLEWRPINGMTVTGRYSYQTYGQDRDYYASSDTWEGSDGFQNTFLGYGRRTQQKSYSQEVEARISYAKTFKKIHNINLMAASTFTDDNSEQYWFAMDNYGDDNVQNGIWQGTEPYARNPKDGYSYGAVMLSFLGRAEYKLLNRYILNATVRTDGSSKFSPKNRWGTFPSFAAAWIVSEEKFVKEHMPWLTFFKLKGGWGMVGNGWVTEYGWRTMFENTEYMGNPGFVPSQMGNDELKWESTKAWDVGFEFGLLPNQRIRGSLGYYMKKTDGLLYDMTMAPSTGMTTTKVNYANIENRGIEFDVTANIISTTDWAWSMSFNITKNKNKVTHIDSDLVSSSGTSMLTNTVIMEGKSLGLIYGFETDGVFRTQEEIDYYESLNPDHSYQNGTTGRVTIPGDLKYVDQNGDGWVDIATTSKTDRAILGCSRPDFEGGLSTRLSWKGLTLNIQTSFAYGHQKLWQAYAEQFQFNSFEPKNLLSIALDRWTPENPDATAPCMRLNKYQNETVDFAVFDASYWKIQNVSLEYRLPQSWMRRTKVFNSVVIGASVNNLATFTSYPGPSPESFSANMIQGGSIDYGTYPTTRTYNFSIKVSL